MCFASMVKILRSRSWASGAGIARTSTTVGAGPERPPFFFLSEFLTPMSAVQGPTAAKFGADESHEGLGHLPRVAGGGGPPDNGQHNKDRGQSPARKICRPANAVCDPGNPSHYLRLEEEKEIRIVVSDNSCFGAVPRGQICMEPRLYGNYHDGESLKISEN